MNHVEVRLLIPAPYIISLADFTRLQHAADSRSVVLHIEPVTDLLTVAVDRERLACKSIVNDKWDELLREMVWAVVVGAVGGQDRQPIGVVLGADEVVRGGLAGRIGAIRLELLGLGECGISR